jgi:hypothetical protein
MLLGLLLFLPFCEKTFAQTLPSASSAVSAMNLANNYFQAQFPSNYWFRAVYFEGLMDFYQINPQSGGFGRGDQRRFGQQPGNGPRQRFVLPGGLSGWEAADFETDGDAVGNEPSNIPQGRSPLVQPSQTYHRDE